MESAASIETISNSVKTPVENFSEENFGASLLAFDAREIALEAGLWLAGLQSFLHVGNHFSMSEDRAETVGDWTREFRLTQTALIFCSGSVFRLSGIFRQRSDVAAQFDFDADDVFDLSQSLKDAVLLSEAMVRAAPLKFSEWSAWCNFLKNRLTADAAFDKLIETADAAGADFLPDLLKDLIAKNSLSPAMQADLRLVLPRFAKILKNLSVVDRMLKSDEPLKSALVIFSRVQEQIRELMSYLNNRLLRFPDDADEFFNLLDGAAYTASIELRKVYEYELIGVTEIRQTPAIYAKIETAYSLLNDSFQQTLVNFAQLIEPDIEPTELFPNFQTKLRQSIILRENLWEILKIVQQTEQNPEPKQIEKLDAELTEFLDSSLHFLFYKDMETVERFIEEVLVTTDKKDLVPILHRFGAYLETLFGQINMRTALANHPFDNSRE